MRIEVLTTQWSAEGETFAGGIHQVKKPTKAFLRLVAAAEHAGVLRVKASKDERAALAAHVQSQAEGEQARADAQRSGAWYEGNLQQFQVDVDTGVRAPAEIDAEAYVADRTGVTDG